MKSKILRQGKKDNSMYKMDVRHHDGIQNLLSLYNGYENFLQLISVNIFKYLTNHDTLYNISKEEKDLKKIVS